MRFSIVRLLPLCIAVTICLASCKSSFIIEDVNFAQPVESVLEPDPENNIRDQRYAVSFSITPLLVKEGVDHIDNLHLIRDRDGYYYITASGFSSVYLFTPTEGTLKLKIEISTPFGRLESPAFNQRGDHIELIDLENSRTLKLNSNGLIVEDAL